MALEEQNTRYLISPGRPLKDLAPVSLHNLITSCFPKRVYTKPDELNTVIYTGADLHVFADSEKIFFEHVYPPLA